MVTRKAVRQAKASQPAPGASKEEVQKALQFTWALKGHIRAAAKQYLHVAQEIARARDDVLRNGFRKPPPLAKRM